MGGAKAFPLMQPDSCRMVHTRACRGSFVAVLCPAHCDVQWAARLRTDAARRDLFPSSHLVGLCSFAILIRSWQAEEAVANLPLRLAVRVHCRHQVRWGPLGVLIHSMGIPEYSQRTLGGTYSLHGLIATGQHAARNALPLPADLPSFSCRLGRVCR